MGLMLAEPEFHTRCFVEWEEYPRSTLIAAQRAGYFAPAPIWDDVQTFDAKPLTGAIDTILAGYPCQPFSHAGARRGENDERHLWPDIERIIGELGPSLRWCFFENVAGHLSLGLDTVLNALRDLGFTNSVGLFSAQEVGASHERKRVFIVSYRPDRESSIQDNLADTRDPRPQRRKQRGALGQRNREKAHGSTTQFCRPSIFPPGPSDADEWNYTISVAPNLAPSVAFGDIARQANQFAALVASGELEEAKAEPFLCRMVDGLAQRSRALRLLGNGVVPLAAAYAWRSLSAAHGLGWMDLGAIEGAAEARANGI